MCLNSYHPINQENLIKVGDIRSMGEMERTRVMKELTRLLQNSSGAVESEIEGELDEWVAAIK